MEQLSAGTASPESVPDDFYSKLEPRLRRRIGRELRRAYRVLDMGCGSCALAQFLRKTYRQRVTGVDIADGRFPRHDAPSPRRTALRCVKADATNLDFLKDGAVDAVVSVWALHEMRDADGMLREARRVLRPGGQVLIVDFPRGSLAQRLWNENYLSPSEVRDKLARAGFQDIRVRTIEKDQMIWATAAQPTMGGAAQ